MKLVDYLLTVLTKLIISNLQLLSLLRKNVSSFRTLCQYCDAIKVNLQEMFQKLIQINFKHQQNIFVYGYEITIS